MLWCAKELARMKFVSIIIPVLDEEATLLANLNSLQILRENQCEIILVDGGSSDRSAEIAKPLVDELFVTAPGRSHQMNFGAENSKGEILIFLHADSRISVDAVSQLIGKTRSLNHFWGWFRLAFDNSSIAFLTISFFMRLRSKVTKVCTGDQTLFISSRLFEHIGGFPNIPIMEDVAISKILRTCAPPIELKNITRSSARRWEQNGVFKTVVFMWYLRLLYWFGVSPDKLVQRYYPKRLTTDISFKIHPLTYKYRNASILLFARAPILGKVKTRLLKVLTDSQILCLYKSMFERVISLLDESNLAEIHLWLDIDSSARSKIIQDLPTSFKLREQVNGDLGEKMSFAIRRTLNFDNSEFAIIIGVDCPALSYDYLDRALQYLHDGVDLVLGPAEDGGYVLIGMNNSYSEIFEGISWGTSDVLEETILKAKKIGVDHICLEPLWDVDRPDDLLRLSELESVFKWVT